MVVAWLLHGFIVYATFVAWLAASSGNSSSSFASSTHDCRRPMILLKPSSVSGNAATTQHSPAICSGYRYRAIWSVHHSLFMKCDNSDPRYLSLGPCLCVNQRMAVSWEDACFSNCQPEATTCRISGRTVRLIIRRPRSSRNPAFLPLWLWVSSPRKKEQDETSLI